MGGRTGGWLRAAHLGALLALALPASARAGQLDQLDLGLRERFAVPILWDNVEGRPHHVSGPRPHRKKGRHHVVTLSVGQPLVLHQDRGSDLLIRSLRGALGRELTVWVSSGSPLFVERRLAPTPDGALLLPAEGNASRLVRLEPLSGPTLEVALFVSRSDPLGPMAPSRDLIRPANAPVRLRRVDEATATDYWKIAPGRPLTVDVRGPARVTLEARLAYPPLEARPQHSVRIGVDAGAAGKQELEIETTAESTHTVLVDGVAVPVGRLESVAFNVPATARRIVLDPSATLYVRLLALSEHDYLIPGANAPPGLSAVTRSAAASAAADIWSIPVSDGTRTVGAGPRTVIQTEQLAWRLARDNTAREGGMVGAALLLEAARARPDAPAIQRAADVLRNRYTAFTNLAPVAKPAGATQRVLWFVPRELAGPEAAPRDGLAAEQHAAALVGRLPSALFVTLPPGRAIEFALPARTVPSTLRLAVSGSPGARAWLELDGARHGAVLLVPEAEVAAAPTDPSDALIGLSLISWLAGERPGATTAGVFARYQVPGGRVDAASAELPVPPSVRRVRIVGADGSQALEVALQIRASPMHRLTETEALDLLARVPGESYRKLMARVLAGEASVGSTPQERDLTNAWVPLARLLEQESRRFGSGLVAEPTSRARGAAPATRARAAAASGQWTEALEEWQAVLSAGGPHRGEALFGRVDALEALGETYLADRQLRAIILFESDASVRGRAVDRLRRDLVRAGDEMGRLTLAAFEIRRTPASTVARRELADALWGAGMDEMSLWVGLGLEPAGRPSANMVRAALGLGWWDAAGRLAAEAKDPSARQSLMFETLAIRGKPPEPAASTAADTGSKDLERRFAEGLAIERRLASSSPDERARAVLAWEAWQERLPGPRRFRAEPVVFDHAGAVVLRSVGRDLLGTAYLATPSVPVRMRIAGPVRVRIDARPLHGAGPVSALFDTLEIRRPGLLMPVPVLNNLPSEGLEVVDRPGTHVGTEVREVVVLGPGVHDLEVRGLRASYAVEALVERADVRLGALPPFTPDTLAAALSGDWVRATPPLPGRSGQPGAGRTPPVRGTPRLRIVHPAPAGGQTIVELAAPPRMTRETPSGGPALAYRMRLRMPHGPDKTADLERLLGDPAVPDAERIEAGLRLGRQDSLPPTAAYTALVMHDLAKGETEEALERQPLTAADVVLRLRVLLRALEDDGDTLATAQIEADRTLRQHSRLVGAAPLAQRILAGRDWQALTDLESAGQRTVEVPTSMLEGPGARVRAALSRRAAPGEHVLMGSDDLVLFRQDPDATRVVIDLEMADVAHLPSVPLRAEYQLDEGPVESVQLTPDSRARRIEISMPGGEHGLRIRVPETVANQFLRVRFSERTAGGSTPLADRDERIVHLATRERPVRARVQGPALLRVDELVGDRTFTRYHQLAPGWRELVLQPHEGRSESQYRVFSSVPGDRTRLPTTRYVPFRVLPPAAGISAASWAPVAPARTAGWPLGDQEDGTWSLGARAVRRRAVQEDVDRQLVPEEFRELRGTYRYFDSDKRNHWQGGVLGRERDEGGAVLGLDAAFRHEPARLPFSLLVEASLFVQSPGEAVRAGTDDTEVAASLRGTVRQLRPITPRLAHSPSVSVFARALSLTASRLYPVGRVDQDIFTPFKADHLSGLVLAEELTWRPWLDALVYGNLSLTSNQLDSPDADNLRLVTGWRQRVGDTELDLGWRRSRYFVDRDRPTASTRRFLLFEATTDVLLPLRRRVELGVQIVQDLDRNETTGMALATWHLGHARAYRDFRPGEVEFLELRRRRMTEERR